MGLFLFFLTAVFSLVSAAIVKVDFLSTPDGVVDLRYLTGVMLVAVVTVMHVFYLLAVISVNVLEDSTYPDNIHVRVKRLLTTLLVLAYCIPLFLGILVALWDLIGAGNTFSVGFLTLNTPTQKVISLLAFGLVYILWIYVDFSEYQIATRGMTNERALNQFLIWLFIEVLTLSIILISLYLIVTSDTYECDKYIKRNDCLQWWGDRWDVFGKKVHLLDPKDFFVFFCVLGLSWRYFVKHDSMPIAESYTEVYRRYVGKCLLHEYAPTAGNDPQLAQLREELVTRLASGQAVLDFGSGDGKRLRELLERFAGLAPHVIAKLAIHSVDRNSDWQGPHGEEWANTLNRFSASPPEDAQFGIIHLSHVLYEERAQRDAEAVIRKHGAPGALVIVRGAGANSPFYIVSLARAARLLDYHPHHHWVEIYLLELKRRLCLVPLQEGTEPGGLQPCVRVSQSVSIFPDASPLAAVLGIIFSREARPSVQSALDALGRQGVTTVPNDDNIWAFRFPGARESKIAPTGVGSHAR